jgi:transposase
MSAAACCVAGSRVVSCSCVPGRARRTRSTRCCSVAWRADRRARSCRWRSASRSDAGVRHVEFLDSEIAAVERLIAQQALGWPEIRRLMTVPGVNLICAATFIPAVGDAGRFLTSRKLVAYLGLDPKVRQSGQAPARSGRISKRGSAAARWALVEAAWSAVLQPGPLDLPATNASDPRTPAPQHPGPREAALGEPLTFIGRAKD